MVGVMSNSKKIVLNNVIYAESLMKNLLSLRKFAGRGLSIYLDNKIIDIYDPMSKESFITGIYSSPYWIIELEVDRRENKTDRKIEEREIQIIALQKVKIRILDILQGAWLKIVVMGKITI